MLSDEDIIEQFDEDKGRAIRGLAEQYEQNKINMSFYAGNTMHYEAGVSTGKRKTRTVIFNKVKPFVSAVAGFMIQNRRKPNYQAVSVENTAQQERSEYLNAISDNQRQNANADQIETVQDIDMLICGIGFTETSLSSERNPGGETVIERIHPNDVGWDPQARASNLLDSRFIFRSRKYHRKEAEKKFKINDESEVDEGTYQDAQGTGRQWIPNSPSYNTLKIYDDVGEGMINVYSYQWYDLEPYYLAPNPIYKIENPTLVDIVARVLAGVPAMAEGREGSDLFSFDPHADLLVLTPEALSAVKTVLAKLDVELEKPIRMLRRVYYTAVLSGSKVFSKFKNPDQTGFTIKAKTGDWDDDSKVWFGLVRVLREPARYANKALTEMLYTIARNSKGGVMYEKGAVANTARFEKQWADTDAAIQVEAGALSGQKIQPKAQATLPTGYDNILAYSDASLRSSTGINPEFLGNAENKQVSALLERQRRDQVVTVLAVYMDSISLYQREHARLMITFIRLLAENAPGRLVKILGDDGATRFEKLIADKLADEYEVDIGEAPDTITQKSENSELMLTVCDKLVAATGNPMFYSVGVKYLPIKQSDIQQLIQMLQPPPPQPPDPINQRLLESEVKRKEADAEQSSANAVKSGAQVREVLASAALKEAQAQKAGADIDKIYAETTAILDNAAMNRFNPINQMAESYNNGII